MVLLGDELKCKLVLVYFEIVLILTQDRCTVCAKRTIGSEIDLDIMMVNVTRLKWMLDSFCLEIVLSLT